MTRADSPHRLLSKLDEWLEWPDFYRPGCPLCQVETIGLLDRGQYVRDGLRIRTVAEPCGCDVSDYAQAMQAEAVEAGAIS